MQSTLAPWRNARTYAVGGLFEVGYAPASDLLLVHSANGRGIFDCITAERLARDDEEPMDTSDPIRLTAQGFGPLDGQSIRMAGLFGGALPLTTTDHHRLEEHSPDWPNRAILLVKPDRSKTPAGDDGECELRAFGFSETGRSFVIATSCELVIFNRD